MLILSCSSKLRRLEGLLQQGLPETLPVYGGVMHVNRGNPAGHEVLVDSWPEFKIVLTRPRREVGCDPGNYYTNLYSAFYREEGACRALLGSSDAVDWSQAFQIQGLQDGVCEAVRDIARARRVDVETYQYQTLLHPDPPAMPQHRPGKGLTLAPVSPAHAALLNDTWGFGGNSWSLDFLGRLIRHFPSACLLTPEGHPISWVLSDPLACLTHGYTLPGHRGQGYVGVLVGVLATQLHARGFPVYVAVLPENQPSLRSLHRLGFHTQPGLFYQLVVTPRPTQAQPASALDSAQGPAPSSWGCPLPTAKIPHQAPCPSPQSPHRAPCPPPHSPEPHGLKLEQRGGVRSPQALGAARAVLKLGCPRDQAGCGAVTAGCSGGVVGGSSRGQAGSKGLQ